MQMSKHPDVQTITKYRRTDVQTSKHEDVQTPKRANVQTFKQENEFTIPNVLHDLHVNVHNPPTLARAHAHDSHTLQLRNSSTPQALLFAKTYSGLTCRLTTICKNVLSCHLSTHNSFSTHNNFTTLESALEPTLGVSTWATTNSQQMCTSLESPLESALEPTLESALEPTPDLPRH